MEEGKRREVEKEEGGGRGRGRKGDRKGGSFPFLFFLFVRLCFFLSGRSCVQTIFLLLYTLCLISSSSSHNIYCPLIVTFV